MSPGLSNFWCTQQFSTSCRRLWMCVRARVLPPPHEDEMWMIQMKAFFSPVPLNVGPALSRRDA